MAYPDAKAADHPSRFTFDDELTNQLPILDQQESDDLAAVIRSLAIGRAPRIGAVTTALNAYNIVQTPVNGKRTWAYFHTITDISPADARLKFPPRIALEDNVLNDLFTPWHSINPDPNQGGQSAKTASYRFICFIHKHRVGPRTGKYQNIFTISIWDRELDEMTWHDVYPRGRRDRRAAIMHFWEIVETPACEFTHPRAAFLTKIRYRTAYHACERIEAATRVTIEPPATLFSIISIGLQHMNDGGQDRQVSIVPDKLEIFGGTATTLLPRWFARLLCLCLHAPRQNHEGEWDAAKGGIRNEVKLKELVERFCMAKNSERMDWMRTRGRIQLEALMKEPGGAWLKNIEWLFDTLRMARP
ncbi:hypothetical protein HD806DRAFT_546603 [Xylariaceae sp. AK1471]|nr:hypothetical protein HD806DRAFT_546603 [Xylariaceae sp. AK1471]